MASHNPITGDALVSKRSNENYRDNYDKIFGKKTVDKKETGFGLAPMKAEGETIERPTRQLYIKDPSEFYDVTWYERRIPRALELEVSQVIDKLMEEKGYPEMVHNWDGKHW